MKTRLQPHLKIFVVLLFIQALVWMGHGFIGLVLVLFMAWMENLSFTLGCTLDHVHRTISAFCPAQKKKLQVRRGPNHKTYHIDHRS